MIKLKTGELFEEARQAGRVKNMLDVQRRGGGSYRTIHHLARNGAQATKVDFTALETFLVAGLGFTPAELEAMPLGKLLEFSAEEP